MASTGWRIQMDVWARSPPRASEQDFIVPWVSTTIYKLRDLLILPPLGRQLDNRDEVR